MSKSNKTRFFISKIGGQSAVARECGITRAAVWLWCDQDHIPLAHTNYLKLRYPKAFHQVFVCQAEADKAAQDE